MSKERIDLTDTFQSAVGKLSEGNPGAVTVLLQVMECGPHIDPDNIFGPLGQLLNFDSFGVYGSRIWQLYKYVCGENITAVIAVLRAVQLGIVTRGEMIYAIDNNGKGLDVNETLAKVQQRLPNFAKSASTTSEDGVGDLTNPDNVKKLMSSSKTEREWSDNCDRVKKANGGDYPSFWFMTIIVSGLMNETVSKFTN